MIFAHIPAAQALPVNQLKAMGTIQEFGPEQEGFVSDYNFEGIVSLWNCSGSLVRFEQSRSDDKAVVLTNGHCLGRMPKPNTFVHNKSANTSFGILNPEGKSLGRIRATKIMYGTMTGTDLALFRLDKTYNQILSEYNVRPLTLSNRRPNTGDSIEVISGYWKRGYSCQIETFIHELQEAGWTMKDSIRYSRPGCEVVGGTSGSPIILANSRTVIGINNTGNESGKLCEMNNPCEVDETGKKTANKGYTYGQQTYQIYTCLTDKLEIDLKKDGCQLYH